MYFTFDYKKINKNLAKVNNNEINKVLLLKNMPLDLLSFFIANSILNISSHSGPILNLSTAFNISAIDIIKKSKFNELGRWIPLESNYKRYSFEDLSKKIDDF